MLCFLCLWLYCLFTFVIHKMSMKNFFIPWLFLFIKLGRLFWKSGHGKITNWCFIFLVYKFKQCIFALILHLQTGLKHCPLPHGASQHFLSSLQSSSVEHSYWHVPNLSPSNVGHWPGISKNDYFLHIIKHKWFLCLNRNVSFAS